MKKITCPCGETFSDKQARLDSYAGFDKSGVLLIATIQCPYCGAFERIMKGVSQFSWVEEEE